MTQVRAPWNNIQKPNDSERKKFGSTQTKHGNVFILIFGLIIFAVLYLAISTIVGN